MNWPLVQFKDVAQIVTGSTPKKVDGNYNGDVPFVTPGDLGIKAVISSSKTTVTEEGAKSGRLLPQGTVMVCCIGATIGKVGIADRNVISNQQINSLIFDESKVYPKYGYYFCTTLKPLLVARSSSTTMPIVNKSNFSEFEIPLPPLDEQKRIAAILDKADAIRRKRQQAINLADDFLRSVFLDMFGDPVTNPKGINLNKFSSVADFINGDRSSNYPSGPDLIAQGVLFLNTKNIVKNQLDFKSKTFISQEKFDSLSRGKLQRGDLVITLRGTLGSCAIFDTKYETGFINAQIMILRCKEEVIPEYLHALLTTKSFHSMLQRIGQGAAVPQLTATQLKALNLPIPTIELQKKFVDILNNYKEVIKKFDGNNASYLFNSLSQKAFSGEL